MLRAKNLPWNAACKKLKRKHNFSQLRDLPSLSYRFDVLTLLTYFLLLRTYVHFLDMPS